MPRERGRHEPETADSEEADYLPCSFCGKEPLDIEMMMSSGSVRICNECLFIGMVMLEQETGVDFEALVEAARRHPSLKAVGGGST